MLLAGVQVGSVGSVRLAGNSVIATLDLNDGTVLPARHRGGGAGADAARPGGRRACSRSADGPTRSGPGALINNTSVPVQIYQLQNAAGHLLTKTDTPALNTLVDQLATGHPGQADPGEGDHQRAGRARPPP